MSDIAAAPTVPPSIETLREALRPSNVRLGSHAGSIDVVEVSPDGMVTLEFQGACAACPSRPSTYVAAVLPDLEGIAGIKRIAVQGMAVSEHALARIRKLLA